MAENTATEYERAANQRCAQCKFATSGRVPGQILSVMMCRRFPPVSVVVNNQLVTFPPVVNKDQWCWEWQERPAEMGPVLTGKPERSERKRVLTS